MNVPSTISPGPCLLPALTILGGLSTMDMKFGSSPACFGRGTVFDICLHSGHRWNKGRCGRRHAALEATLRVWERVERPALMIAELYLIYVSLKLRTNCLDMSDKASVKLVWKAESGINGRIGSSLHKRQSQLRKQRLIKSIKLVTCKGSAIALIITGGRAGVADES